MKENKIYLTDNELRFNPAGMDYTYGILITYPEKKQTLHYEADIAFKKEAAGRERVFSVNRRQAYINNKLPEAKIYELTERLNRSIYPAMCGIDNKGNIVGLLNHADIVKRTESTAAELKEYFAGEISDSIFSHFEIQCSNAAMLRATLENDLLYAICFLPVHAKYDSALTATFEKRFLLGEKIVPFAMKATLAPDYNEKGKVPVTVTGICAGYEYGDAAFNAQYNLYREDHSISLVEGSFIFPEGKNNMATIQFELYHLNAAQRIINKSTSFTDRYDEDMPGSKRQSLIVDEGGPADKRKSFWDMFR